MRKRWDRVAGTHVCDTPRNRAAEAFLAEIEDVCRRHGLSLSHEDQHGGFEVVDLDQGAIDWVSSAAICFRVSEPKLNRGSKS